MLKKLKEYRAAKKRDKEIQSLRRVANVMGWIKQEPFRIRFNYHITEENFRNMLDFISPDFEEFLKSQIVLIEKEIEELENKPL